MSIVDKYLNDEVLIQSMTDMRLQVGLPPFVNINCRWMPHPRLTEPMSQTEMIDFIAETHRANIEGDLKDEKTVDFCFDAMVGGIPHRFRGHQSENYRGVALDIRILRSAIDPLTSLGFPATLGPQLFSKKSGLVIIGGPTGSGKSTTLASWVRAFADISPGALSVSLEDPVEYVFNWEHCLISQKHVGYHVENWSEGIYNAKREKPNLMIIGEVRTPDAIQAAVEAACSGHMVITTMHADRIPRVLDAIVDNHPQEMTRSIQTKLSYILRGVICQTLVPTQVTDHASTRPSLVYEILANENTPVQSTLLHGTWASFEVKSIEDQKSVSQSWEKRILELETSGQISTETAQSLKSR
jgi:twitching motility protein PilT